MTWHYLWFFGDTYHHLKWWVWLFGYLGSIKNTNPAGPDEKLSYPHPTSRSCPDSGILVALLSHLACRLDGGIRVSYEGLLCYLCFCTTLVSMLPKFNLLLENSNRIIKHSVKWIFNIIDIDILNYNKKYIGIMNF